MSHRLLVIGPAWVGDMVVAQSLFKLCKANADVELDVLAPKWSRPLLDFMPEVDNVIPLDINHGELALKTRRQIAIQCRDRYQQAIVIPRSFKAALIPFWARIPRRTGWLGEYRWGLLNDIRHLDKIKYPSLQARYSILGQEHGATPCYDYRPSFEVSSEQLAACRKKFQPDDRKIVALCPGAEYGPAKQWPAKRFAALAKQLDSQGYKPWLLGSPKDQPIAHEIQTLADQVCLDLTGKTSLSDAVACLALADVAVSNDSGLMHIAAALKTPVVALYGSSDPNYTPPLSDQAHILSRDLSCRPCFKRQCPLGTTACLDIEAGLVFDKIKQALGESCLH